MRRLVAPALAVLCLAACETFYTDKYEAPTARKYPTPEGASQKCLDAAAKARKWCMQQTVNTDTTWANNCRDAQWEYSQACR